MGEEKKEYTFAMLKEFCNSLTDEQLVQTVRVVQEEGSIPISGASELGEDHYYFDDYETSITRDEFDLNIFDEDPPIKTMDEAIERLNPTLCSGTRIFLYEDF